MNQRKKDAKRPPLLPGCHGEGNDQQASTALPSSNPESSSSNDDDDDNDNDDDDITQSHRSSNSGANRSDADVDVDADVDPDTSSIQRQPATVATATATTATANQTIITNDAAVARSRLSRDISPFDVLLGKGRPYQDHLGNLRMHQIVNQFRRQYSNASRTDKPKIAKTVLTTVKGDVNARFMRRADVEGAIDLWEEVSDDTARDKITHAFRNRPRSGPEISSLAGLSVYQNTGTSTSTLHHHLYDNSSFSSSQMANVGTRQPTATTMPAAQLAQPLLRHTASLPSPLNRTLPPPPQPPNTSIWNSNLLPTPQQQPQNDQQLLQSAALARLMGGTANTTTGTGWWNQSALPTTTAAENSLVQRLLLPSLLDQHLLQQQQQQHQQQQRQQQLQLQQLQLSTLLNPQLDSNNAALRMAMQSMQGRSGSQLVNSSAQQQHEQLLSSLLLQQLNAGGTTTATAAYVPQLTQNMSTVTLPPSSSDALRAQLLNLLSSGNQDGRSDPTKKDPHEDDRKKPSR